MQERFKLLLQSNTGLSAALSYTRSRPPINLLPLFDSLDDAQAAALMRGGSSRTSWGSKVWVCWQWVAVTAVAVAAVTSAAMASGQRQQHCNGDGNSNGNFSACTMALLTAAFDHIQMKLRPKPFCVFCLCLSLLSPTTYHNHHTQDPHNNHSSSSTPASARRCHWKVFYPEQVIAAAGGPIHDIIVITKGAVRMFFPPGVGANRGIKPHTVVASVGELMAFGPAVE